MGGRVAGLVRLMSKAGSSRGQERAEGIHGDDGGRAAGECHVAFAGTRYSVSSSSSKHKFLCKYCNQAARALTIHGEHGSGGRYLERVPAYQQ